MFLLGLLKKPSWLWYSGVGQRGDLVNESSGALGMCNQYLVSQIGIEAATTFAAAALEWSKNIDIIISIRVSEFRFPKPLFYQLIATFSPAVSHHPTLFHV